MKHAIIMIGLPGSGKSTKTKELLSKLPKEKTSAVHSTDNYHIINGSYVFQPKKLGYFHKLNQEAFKKSIDNQIDLVICDNTNILARDRKPYISYAEKNGYKVTLEVVGEFTEEFAQVCAERNTHGVPLDSILRMARKVQLP